MAHTTDRKSVRFTLSLCPDAAEAPGRSIAFPLQPRVRAQPATLGRIPMARQIYGVGVDIVSTSRIKHVYGKYGDKFLQKAFHPDEAEIFRGTQCFDFLACRWAAKEATQKALSRPRLLFPEIKIISENYPAKGRPILTVEGSVELEFFRKGICKSHVSMSHEEGRAVATVILEESADV